MNLEACLPAALRQPTTTITRIAAGLSGAGVYRVEAGGQTFVLKIASEATPLEDWRHKLQILELASDAELAPRVIHVDEARRAVTSAFVVDRSFPSLFWNPETRAAAIVLLGQTLRRAHDLPLPANTQASDARAVVAKVWAGLADFAVPAFVAEAVRRELATEPPPDDRPLVLSHNDVNPTNMAYDGERLVLLDWDAAAANDPFYDLAAAAVFHRMDDATCARLVAAHDGVAVAALPARFRYLRRLIAVQVGTMFLHLARTRGHAGARGDETLETTLGLADVYQQMRAGTLSPATADGQWTFGLALVKASADQG